jgi:hypothetical protein
VQNASVWQLLLGLTRTVVEAVEIDEVARTIVVSVQPSKGAARRCGPCGRRAGLYDRARDGGAGALSTSASYPASSRPVPRGCGARPTE